MINFRYHVISLVAVFLALAVGVALGSGPLNGTVSERLEADSSGTEARTDLEHAEDLTAFQDEVATTLGAPVLGTRLANRGVAIFTLPGADPATVKNLSADIRSAGGTVTATVALTDKAVDPGERQFAEGVAQQSLDGVAGVPDTEGMSSYQLLGTGLARSYLTSGDSTSVDSAASTIASAYDEAGFITTDGAPDARAVLAVFVGGAPASDAIGGTDTLVATVAGAVDDASSGAVLVGPPAAADEDGYVRAVRESEVAGTVSTIDTASVVSGRLVTVIALQREVSGESGHYGVGDGADAAMPEITVPGESG